MTLHTFLTQQKKNISPDLSRDVEIIFCEVLGISDIQLITQSQKILTEEQMLEISEKISERISGKSISEIFQKKMFFGEEFWVTNDVLTPRPETEFLVEKALSLYVRGGERGDEISGFVDIGTGSGCIITSIAKNSKNIDEGRMQYAPTFLAGDISEKALTVARKNAEKILGDHKGKPLQTIDFIKSDLLENFLYLDSHRLHTSILSNKRNKISGKIIVTNLPYIPQKDEEWMEREVLGGDPHLALFSGETGTDLYQKFFLQLKKFPDFYAVIFEYDPPQTEFFQKFLKKHFPERSVEFFPDLFGKIRFGLVM